MSDMPIPQPDQDGRLKSRPSMVRMMVRVRCVENLRKKAMPGLPDQRRTLTFFPQTEKMKVIFP
jgi:hypothetical protein